MRTLLVIIAISTLISCNKKELESITEVKDFIEQDTLWIKYNHDVQNDSVPQIQHSNIKSLLEHNNKIWISTPNGISAIDDSGIINYVDLSPSYLRLYNNEMIFNNTTFNNGQVISKFNDWEWIPHYELNQQLTPYTNMNNQLFRVSDLVENDNKLFIAFGYKGVLIKQLDSFKELNNIPYQMINSFKVDSKNRVWFLGGYGYLGNRRDTLPMELAYYYEDSLNVLTLPEPIKSCDITAVEDVNGITISSSYWQKTFRYESGIWIDITDDFPSNQVSDFIYDKSGILWISSYNNGVAKLSNDNWVIFNQGNHLPTNYIHTMYFDSANNCWIPTDTDGLIMYRNI